MKHLIQSLLLTFLILSASCSGEKNNDAATVREVDICVYGGTSAGVVAAYSAQKLGKSVLLVEPGKYLGGMTTGGLGMTDIGNKYAVTGLARLFYRRVGEHYNKFEQWTFPPSVATEVMNRFVTDADLEVIRFRRIIQADVQDKRICSITLEDSNTPEQTPHLIVKAKQFIDCTYEGDLMARAGVSYFTGRESNETYDETLNGVQANRLNYTLKRWTSVNGYNHNLVEGVDPYVIKGDPSSGLLPGISGEAPGVDGSGDKKIQAYCFRMTLTDHPDNRIPFQKPDNYRESDYELLFRNYEAAGSNIRLMNSYGGHHVIPWINSPMPNRKTDTNNCHGFASDFIGQNYNYPEASYEERERIVRAHLDYQQGLMWTLANHPRIPLEVRKEVSRWGTCKDEYKAGDNGWQRQLYIREARRMLGCYVITQHHCEGLEVSPDPIGMAAYTMDSHHVQRYVDRNGYVKNEGNVEAPVGKPFPISYRAIVPRKDECTNLLVPVCLSSSHIAFGSIRMEPVFMVLGQSAATAACQAIDEKCGVQDISYERLRSKLVEDKQVLHN